jgi:hypothetical protein
MAAIEAQFGVGALGHRLTRRAGWPIQTPLWRSLDRLGISARGSDPAQTPQLEWGGFTAVQSRPASLSRFCAVHSDSISTRPSARHCENTYL